MSEEELGISHSNRQLIVVLVFLALLIWGPIEPYGMVVRVSYLILLPTLLWFVLGYVGKKWRAGKLENDRLSRAIAGVVAGILFVGAYFSFTADYHTECTQEVPTRDGRECVGDFVTVKGPDKVGGLIEVGLGVLAVWYAISERKEES